MCALCCSYMLASFPHTCATHVGIRLPWDGFMPVYRNLCCVSSACLCPYPFARGHSALFTASCFHPPGPIMMSLRPGSELLDSQTLPPERPLSNSMVQVSPQPLEPMTQPAEDGDQASFSLLEEKVPKWAAEHQLQEKSWITNGFDVFECPPPKTENEVGWEGPAEWDRVARFEGNEDRRQPQLDGLGRALTCLGNPVTAWALNSSRIPR